MMRWTPPGDLNDIKVPKSSRCLDHQIRQEESAVKNTTIAIDLAKSVLKLECPTGRATLPQTTDCRGPRSLCSWPMRRRPRSSWKPAALLTTGEEPSRVSVTT